MDKVTAIIVAMTDEEKPYYADALLSVLEQPEVDQIIICCSLNNDWIVAINNIEILKFPIAPPGEIRNKAIEFVKNPWIAFLDADDIWLKQKIQLQLAWAKTNNSDFIGTDNYLIDGAGQIKAFALCKYMPMVSTWLVKTSVLKKYKFNGNLSVASDGDWWVRFQDKFSTTRYAYPLTKYRVRKNSVSSKTKTKKRKFFLITLARLPVLDKIIFFLTWLLWLTHRKRFYSWHKEWKKPG